MTRAMRGRLLRLLGECFEQTCADLARVLERGAGVSSCPKEGGKKAAEQIWPVLQASVEYGGIGLVGPHVLG